LLAAWNATDAAYPHHRCVHALFEAQAERAPEAPAIIHGAQTVTYGELNRRAATLASQLRALGVGPETLVGLMMERSIEQLVSVLAILKAGGAYVPLDLAHPRERLALILADTAAPVLLTQRRLLDRIPASEAAILCVDDDLLTAPEVEAIPAEAGPENLAYVIYTSGSTGVPKGVLIDHRGLTNHTFAMIESHALDASDRVLQFSSLSFDASAASLFPALVAGACLILPELPLAELVGDQLTQLCEELRVTVVQLPASVWHQWVDDMAARGHLLTAPLKVLLVGGEPPLMEKLRAWVGLTGRPMRFMNAYGPTEAAVTTTLFVGPCDQTAAEDLERVPIGRPLGNKQVFVLDAEQRQLPIGASGELYIGGIGLARGYLNRPELTAERFISWRPDPAAEPQRLYRTGDLVRFRPDGQLEFLGRADHQVKLRGFRIELGEIEAALRRHPVVRDAVVIVREDEPGSPQLAAYLVLVDKSAGGPGLSRSEVRNHLRSALPEYMIPTAFVELEQFPLNANGKLDRRALPPPLRERREVGWAAPASADELLIGRLWAQALSRSHIRAHDNFFDLGGHSLAAARAVAMVNAALGCDLPLRLIYEAPTVASFARALSDGAARIAVPTAAELAAEVVLDPAIRPRGVSRAPKAGRAIFLTGATGYLGAFLLQELLDHTDATVYCLVRATHPQEGRERLAQIAERYKLGFGAQTERVVPVLGDLRRPLLGLSRQGFRRLARTVDAIYHAGAQVHYLYPYAALKAANVQGTVEVLRLACSGAPKPVHYISTLATTLRDAGPAVIGEDDPLGPCESTRGYDQSKWVAERLVQLAGSRGLPVAIYRPGRIGSHSRTGVFNPDDFFVRLLAGCLALGQAPDIDLLENLLPVDMVARAVVGLSARPVEPRAVTFHLLNPQHTSWRWLVGQVAARGHELALVPYAEWHLALGQAVADDPGHHLAGLLPYLPADLREATWIDVLARHSFDAARGSTGLCLDGAASPFGPVELERLLAEGVRRGVFPQPGRELVASGAAAVGALAAT
jgi:amino acid adenylation domain-containing protein/thioester reductase-like protein